MTESLELHKKIREARKLRDGRIDLISNKKNLFPLQEVPKVVLHLIPLDIFDI